jgi:hypothetical protein
VHADFFSLYAVLRPACVDPEVGGVGGSAPRRGAFFYTCLCILLSSEGDHYWARCTPCECLRTDCCVAPQKKKSLNRPSTISTARVSLSDLSTLAWMGDSSMGDVRVTSHHPVGGPSSHEFYCGGCPGRCPCATEKFHQVPSRKRMVACGLAVRRSAHMHTYVCTYARV